MNSELKSRFENLAFKRAIPFCYSCYTEAPTGRCSACLSDDLMLLLPSVGCEYGSDWVIRELLLAEAPEIDLDEQFEESIRSCYPEESTIGWLTVDTTSTIKQLDPISWNLAKSEWIDAEEQDGRIVSFDNGSTFYDLTELEHYLDSQGV